MSFLTEDTDVLNEQILEDLVADFDTFLYQRDFKNCDAVIDNLRDLGKYEKGIELAKRLTAAKMRLPDDYGLQEETLLFAEKDNPLKNVKVEGYEEEQEVW